MNKTSKKLLATGFLLAVMTAASFAQQPKVEVDSAGVPIAAPEAAVDQVAYSYQKRAIAKLKLMIQRKTGQSSEPVFLMRLARLQQENADVTFRIAHSEAFFAKRPIALGQYKNAMKESIGSLNRLIQLYPTYPEVPMAYYLRSRALDEVGNTAGAKQGYLFLIKNHPNFKEINKVYLALAGIAEQDSNYSLAIEYLKIVVNRETEAEYPIALYKISWAYYYIKDVDKTFAYARDYINYFNRKILQAENQGRIDTSSLLARDDMVRDGALFYVLGFEIRGSSYPISKAIPFFKSLTEGPKADSAYAKVLLKIAKLLRVNSHPEALAEWKDIVVAQESARPESLDVLMVTYEDQLNRSNYRQLIKSLDDFVLLSRIKTEKYQFDRAEKLLLDSAEQLQKQFLNNVGRNTGVSLSVILVGIYNSFIAVAKDSDPRLYLVHYNIAEAYAGVEKRDPAIRHYQWIVDHRSELGESTEQSGKTKKPKLSVPVVQVALKIARLNYEGLKAANRIPKDLKPAPIDDASSKPIDPAVQRWISSIEQVEKLSAKTSPKDLEFYHFEATRTLYVDGNVSEAVKRLVDFGNRYRDSKYSEPSATLLLDTLIASNRWNAVHRYSNSFLKREGWRKPFVVKLQEVASNAYYKMTEELYNAKDYSGVLSNAELFKSDYSSSPRKDDFLNLFARAAMGDEQKPKAMEYFSQLIQEMPKSSHYAEFLLLRGKQFESSFEFNLAARDYQQFAKIDSALKPNEQRALKEKILLLNWLAGDFEALSKQIGDTGFCGGDISNLCNRYAALSELRAIQDSKKKSPLKIALDQSLGQTKIPAQNRALWAAVALSGGADLSTEQKLNLVSTIQNGAKQIEPLFAYSLIPTLNLTLSRTFEDIRLEISRKNPVKADQALIKKRVAVVQKAEKSANDLLQFPWIRIQVSILNTVADLYRDLGAELSELQAPKGSSPEDDAAFKETLAQIAKPFFENAKKIRERSFGLASDSGVDDEVFQKIALTYFKEAPEQGTALLAGENFPLPQTLDVSILDKMDSGGEWTTDGGASDKFSSEYWKQVWLRAIRDKQIPMVGYIVQWIAGSPVGIKPIKPEVLNGMKAVSLALVGSRSEGAMALSEALNSGEPTVKDQVVVLLLKVFGNTLSKAKVSGLISQGNRDAIRGGLNRDELARIQRLYGKEI